MVFIGTVLAKTPGVNKAKDIRARLLRRMDHWTDSQIGALVEDTCGTGKSRGARAGKISEKDYDRNPSHGGAARRQGTTLEQRATHGLHRDSAGQDTRSK